MGAHGKMERTGRTFAIPLLKSKNFFSDCKVTLEKTVFPREFLYRIFHWEKMLLCSELRVIRMQANLLFSCLILREDGAPWSHTPPASRDPSLYWFMGLGVLRMSVRISKWDSWWGGWIRCLFSWRTAEALGRELILREEKVGHISLVLEVGEKRWFQEQHDISP